MFYWPCISIHPCNENQLYALFILSLFRQSTSTCFGHIFSPSSGSTLYIYSVPPDDGLQICPKHVEVDWRNKLRINNASSWFSLHEQIFSYHSFFVFPSPLSFDSTFSTVTSSFLSRFPFFFHSFFHAHFSCCYLLHLYIFTLLMFPSLLNFGTFLSQKWILSNCNIKQLTAMFLHDCIQIFLIVVLSYKVGVVTWPDLTCSVLKWASECVVRLSLFTFFRTG